MSVGDTVRVIGTNHVAEIVSINNGWFVLSSKHESHCCNYYSINELEMVNKQINNS